MGILLTSAPFVAYSSMLMRFQATARRGLTPHQLLHGEIQLLLYISDTIQVSPKHVFCRFAKRGSAEWRGAGRGGGSFGRLEGDSVHSDCCPCCTQKHGGE